VAELSLGTVVSVCVFQESVCSSVSARNFVVQVLAIFLFPCTTFKSFEELCKLNARKKKTQSFCACSRALNRSGKGLKKRAKCMKNANNIKQL
jgi:hypothetical protein